MSSEDETSHPSQQTDSQPSIGRTDSEFRGDNPSSATRGNNPGSEPGANNFSSEPRAGNPSSESRGDNPSLESRGDNPSLDASGDDLSSTHYLVAEEYTVGVPLVRPKAKFLEILRSAGGTGEIFTKKEICQFLKTYISTRKLYDIYDPRVVYCKNDQLGKVFGVDKFTIDDVINLINQNCNQVPDTCIKRKRHLVARPKERQQQNPNSHPAPNSQIVTTVANTPSSLTIEVCRASPVISSTSDPQTSTSRRRSPKLQSDLQSKSEDGSQTSKVSDSKSGEHPRQRRKRKRSTDTKSSESSDSKRRTSLSITYSDAENGAYPWYFQLRMETDDESEVLSIQEKDTVKVQDSTDDLWFVDDDSLPVEEDTFSLEYEVETDDTEHLTDSDSSIYFSGKDVLVVCKDSDIEFWADSSGGDTDNELTDGDKWKCVECSTSNSPLQRYCVRCWKLRPGWLPEKSLRKLPQSRRKIERSMSAPGNMSSSESSVTNLESPRKRFSPSKFRRKIQRRSKELHYDSDSSIDRLAARDDRNNYQKPNKIDSFDSGIYTSSTQPSSQETSTFHKHEKPVKNLFNEICVNTDVCKNNITEKISPKLDLGIRRTCLNYQSKLNESESKLDEPDGMTNINVIKTTAMLNIEQKTDDGVINNGDTSTMQTKNDSVSSFKNISDNSIKVLPVTNSETSRTSKSCVSDSSPSNVASGSGIQIGGDNCVICMARPKTGSIIHGTTGHQVCCYKCARRLKRQRKPCPVCRRPINKVVKNFIL